MEKIVFTCITLVLHLFGRKKLISSIRKRVKPFHRHTQIRRLLNFCT